MIILYIKYFILILLFILGLIGFVRGGIIGIVRLIEGIRAHDRETIKEAARMFILSLLSLISTFIVWPLIDTDGN